MSHEEQVDRQLAAETERALADLAQLAERERTAQTAYDEADRAYWQVASDGDYDRPVTRKETRRSTNRQKAFSALAQVWAEQEKTQLTIDRLRNPAERERRINDRKDGIRMSTKTDSKTEAAPRTGLPEQTRDRVVELINGGHGLSAAAKILNEEGLTTSTGKAWTAQLARGVYMKATGAEGIGAVRDKHALVRATAKPLAEQEPAKTATAPKASPEGDLAAKVKADPKPSAKAKNGAAAKAADPKPRRQRAAKKDEATA
jgi:hypothetical protein